MGKKKKDVVAADAPTTETKPTLLWNERGQIGCELPGHAPHRGSDTWRFEHWKKIPAGTTKDDGSPYACELCARGEAAGEPAPADAVEAQATDAPSADEKPAPKKGKRAKTDITLADLAERYLRHMETAGKSNGTCFSYRLELQIALGELGADTKLADLTSEKVLLFFGSTRVNKKKNGKVKSPLSIAKTQRVLRLALVWAEKARLIDKAPLPEDLATH